MNPESSKIRNIFISLFVTLWLSLFYYESLRAGFLNPLLHRQLPKFKFLFPPAGWIMFFHVDEIEGRAEVYGFKDQQWNPIDPHLIFADRWIGYDNIRRNILISVLNAESAEPFCRYLKRKFPEYGRFVVAQAVYPSNLKEPGKKILQLTYAC